MLVLFVVAMIFLSFAQVVLRNFFDWGISWGDIGLRNMVLWVGFIGASLATKENRHITIDALTKFLSPSLKALSDVLTSFVSFLVGLIFVWASFHFVAVEKEAGGIAFLNVPFWTLEMIIPIGFSLISFRFLIKVIEDIAYLKNGRGKQ